MKQLIKIILLVVLVGGIQSCFYDKLPELEPFECSEISYSTHLVPIFANNCANAGCHDGVAFDPDLTAPNSYTTLVNDGWIDLLTPENSTIYEEVESGDMPPGGPALSETDVQMILCWISEGAPNN